VTADPWGTNPTPLPDRLPPWTGGFCPQHGNGYQPGCRGCPPSDHLLQRARALRRTPCPVCDGERLVVAEPVPSGAERARAGAVIHVDVRVVRCPLCTARPQETS
jgi:hypothetical protein